MKLYSIYYWESDKEYVALVASASCPSDEEAEQYVREIEYGGNAEITDVYVTEATATTLKGSRVSITCALEADE